VTVAVPRNIKIRPLCKPEDQRKACPWRLQLQTADDKTFHKIFNGLSTSKIHKMHDKLTSETHQNAAWMYRVIKYGAHVSISCGHMTASTTAATTTATLNQGKKKKMTKRQYKTGKI